LKIEVAGRSHVTLTWENEVTELEASRLRGACVCADCRSEPGMKRTAAVLAGDRPVSIERAELRGAYAINFTFGPDGHDTGIFTWDQLRDLGNG
jgi:DUF971 family protein